MFLKMNDFFSFLFKTFGEFGTDLVGLGQAWGRTGLGIVFSMGIHDIATPM